MTFVIRKLNDDQTLGPRLQEMRREANVTLNEMAARTKIRRAYLEAFEQGRYDALPEPLYARQFLRTYVTALGGDPEYFLKRFEEERGTCDFTAASRLPRQRARSTAFFSPARVVKIAVFVLVSLAVVGYLGMQVRAITAPPKLEVLAPTDGLVTAQAMIVVSGLTSDEATVRVNGIEVLLNEDGTFETEVALERGVNVIIIEGNKRYSRPTTIYRRVILEQDRGVPVDNL